MKAKQCWTLFSIILTASLLITACTPATPTAAPTAVPATDLPAASPTDIPTQPPAPEPTTVPVQVTPTIPAATTKTGGKLVVVDNGGFFTMDPFVTPWHSVAQYAAFDTLIALSPDLSRYVGVLAESWTVSSDGLSLTLKLRQGTKFQDGSPVDAEAIKWNFDHYMDAAVDSSYSWVKDTIQEVKATDTQTVVLVLKMAYAPLYYQLASMEMASPKAYKDLGPDKFAQSPIGSGPWKLTEIVPNNSITFTRNPDYAWYPEFLQNRGPAYPDTLTVRYVDDPAIAYASLETGEVQLSPIAPTELKQAQSNKNITIAEGIEPGVLDIAFNTEFKPLDNVNMRLAIAHGINRDEIIQAAYEGQAVAAYSGLAPSIIGYSDAVEAQAKEALGYDPEKAKEMLAAEGYTLGSDGVMVGKDGKKLEFTLSVGTQGERQLVAETIQSQLAEIGVKITLEVLEPLALRDKLLSRKTELVIFKYALLDPSILTLVFHSTRGGLVGYVNPDLDAALEAMDNEMDPAARTQKLNAVLKILYEKAPSLSLTAAKTFMGYRSDLIGGIQFDKLGTAVLGDTFLTQ